MPHFCYIFFGIIIIHALFGVISCIHLKGTFKTDDFFKFITRFGFQKTDVHNEEVTTGYIYGNISVIHEGNRSIPVDSLISLGVMDYNYFIDYYNKRRIKPKSSACTLMFEKINKIAYFFECNEKGREDFIRRVPCPNNKLCIDEDNQYNVIEKNQFTFRIRDLNQARFWYISLSACNRNLETCRWNEIGDRSANNSISVPSYTIAYDIWLVNGNPDYQNQNRFEHQYTYELHDIFEIYLTSLTFLLMLMPMIIYRIHKNFHHLHMQVLVYVSFEVACRVFSLAHNLLFSYNGKGFVPFDWIANFLEAFNSSILFLILISIAKGWTVRSKRLKTDQNFYIMGFLLLIVLVVSHMISLNSIDPVFNTNPYETTAGYVELSVRFFWMAWFLLELKKTFENLDMVASIDQESFQSQFLDVSDIQMIDSEPDDGDDTGDYEVRGNSNNEPRSEFTKKERLRMLKIFYLHFGACCLVWFMYMPCLVFITSFVSELFRLRLVLGIRYLVNYITVILLIYITWAQGTPLQLPGKNQPSVKTDIVSRYLFDTNENEQDENDETVLFIRENLSS